MLPFTINIVNSYDQIVCTSALFLSQYVQGSETRVRPAKWRLPITIEIMAKKRCEVLLRARTECAMQEFTVLSRDFMPTGLLGRFYAH